MRLLALLSALLVQGEAPDFREALNSGDYRGAWEAAESVADPVARARQAAEIYYKAGDPERALAAARAGLALSPGQREFLYYAAGSAAWLQDAALARRYANELARAVESSADLSPSEKQDWDKSVAGFDQLGEELSQHESARESAVTLARALAIGGLCLGIVLSGIAVRRS